MTQHDEGPSTSRRRLLGAAGGVLAGVPTVAQLSSGSLDATGKMQEGTETPTETPEPPETIWPLFQYDARNTGSWSEGFGPRSGPGPRWGHLDGGSYATTPVITDSEVFAVDVDDGVVRSVDRTTGTQRWQRSVDVGSARLTIDDRTLYVPTHRSGEELQARDAADGSRKWTVRLGNSPDSVVATGNSVFAATAGGLYKVSTLSKEVDWYYNEVSLLETSVAITDTAVFAAGTSNGKAVRIDISSGGNSWSNNMDGAAQDAPTVAEGTVVVPFDGFLVALKEESGRELWRYESPVSSSVAVSDGVVYGTTTGGEVFALDLGNGQERWRTGALAGSNPPVLVGNQLYVVGTDGGLMALNPGTGSAAWSADVGAGVAANPAVAGGELYVADQAGRLSAWSAGASGGLGGSTPTPTGATPTTTETRTESSTPTPTRTESGGSTDSGSDPPDPPSATPSTPTDTETATPSDPGGIDLPLVGGGVAAVLAALGGALWWRRNQQDEYDPLG